MQRSFVFFLAALGSWAFEKGFAEETFVRIWPENPVVEFGGSLQINCSASTKADTIGLETRFTRELIGTGSNWKAFRITNINDWNTKSLCYVNANSTKTAVTTITVYKSPASIELDPVTDMEVGKPYNLICRVFGVAPIRNLTVTLLKGEEQLRIKTFEDHTRPEADGVMVNHTIIAQKDDYDKIITCQTSLDLRPRGPLLKNTSQGKSLWTFDFAKTPLLHAGLFLEAGTPMKVTCDAPEVSPAREARFHLWFAGEYLTFNTTVMGDLASAQAVIASSSVGEHELLCMVSLGPVTKNVTKMVNVFALPKPTLQIGSSEAVAGQTVNITCSADGSASPGFKMQIRDAAKILASGNVAFLQHTVIAQQEDNEQEFICQVTLSVDGHTKERSVSQKLTVFYGPQMDDSSCPQTRSWKEGSTTTLTCSALGNPTPTVQCWKDGRPYDIGEPQLVQREHDGIYQCNATNQYGFDVRDVTVHVESPQSTGHIIGYIVAVVAFIALVAGIAYWIRSKQKKRKYQVKKKEQQPPQTAQNSAEQRFLNGKANV
ncbi:intercellular adhesion molecule 5-like [Thamnophis elegans]|uniref:intercellular adhesion molecule 5-like n=1 Tax=Thamnophis elegans TaxID=35005 RepID=UPI0013788AA4|nr:intercellular adhesion molecule 5-like [Thamnophis elegans]